MQILFVFGTAYDISMNLQEVIEKAHQEWKINPRKAVDEQEVIAKFGKMFHPNNIDYMTAEDFKSFLSLKHNKHWGGLERGGGIADDMPKLKKTLKLLLDEKIPIEARIRQIRDKSNSDYHSGFGPAYYTPILLVVYPDKYPVINGVVKEALEVTGLNKNYNSKPEWDAYSEVRPKILELAQKNNLSLWQMDWVWWTILGKKWGFNGLYKFLTEMMDAKTNYQPVVIKTLLESGNMLKEILDEKIRSENPDKDRNFTSKEVYEVLVEKHEIVHRDGNSYSLNLIEELAPEQRRTLIDVCNQKIESFKKSKSLSSGIQYFLVQVMEKGSKEFLNKETYEHPGWQNDSRAADRGLVKPGDILVVYFGGGAIDFKQTLKMIYKVDSIADNRRRFNVSLYKELKGIPFAAIKGSRQNGILSSPFNQLGLQQFNIIRINESDYDSVLSLDEGEQKVIVDDKKFEKAHKLFEKVMFDKSNGIAFENFNHPSLLEEEINYKREIVEKTKNLRIKTNLDMWRETPGRILEEIKLACSQTVCKNLLMGNNYGVEGSSAAALHMIQSSDVKELEIHLYDFFLSADSIPSEFGGSFNALIDFLNIKKLKVDWRFLAYLAFLANPNQYFPIQPTLFEKLAQYYGNQLKLRANFSWSLYSSLLQLAEILKTKLSRYGKLDAIQIQSYMWAVSKLIENMADTQYWLIRPGTGGSDWKYQRERGVIGISFYKELGDLNQYRNGTGEIDEQKLKENIAKYESKPGAVSKNFSQLKQFMSIKEGDKIIAYEGMKRILGVGEVTGKYSYMPDMNQYQTYPVNWHDTNIRESPRVWQGTILSVTKDEFEKLTQQESMASPLPEYDKYKEILIRKKQLIFYGPPGTGKTYTANNFAKWFVFANKARTNSEDVHSMNDDEFNDHVIEEIRKFAESKNYEFVKDLGSFNLVSLKSAHNEIRLAFIFSKSGKQNPEDVYLGISEKMIDFLEHVTMENRFLVIINNDVKNFVTLPYEIEQKYARFVTGEESKKWDNTGKTQHAFRITISPTEAKLLTRQRSYAEKYYDSTQYLGSFDALGIGDYQEPPEFIRRVTFHPSYSYEEFVEGIKPKSRENYVEYPIEDGVFKRISNDARNDPENDYVLIIDEINRGNISKILGELITLIEKDKRNADPLLLTYSKKPFIVPDNLYIIGTMNTADRSLTQLDTAIRRRFGFCELLPDTTLLDQTIEGIHVGNLLERLNQKIRDEGLREKQIGHSYFMKGTDCIDSIEDLQFVFSNEIIPLLQEYFYEDYEKLQKILGSKFVDEKEMKIRDDWKTDDALFLDAVRSFARSI